MNFDGRLTVENFEGMVACYLMPSGSCSLLTSFYLIAKITVVSYCEGKNMLLLYNDDGKGVATLHNVALELENEDKWDKVEEGNRTTYTKRP